MAWTGFPIADGDDFHAYDKVIQLWQATREKYWALGTYHFPRTNIPWDAGDTWTMAANGDGTYTLTDATKDWTPPVISGPCTSSGTRWVGYSNTCTPYIPSDYDCIFDHLDVKKVVRAQIVENTTTTLKLSGLDQYVTEGVIGSVSELNGRKYYIIKRGGLWWSDRWPEWPSSFALWLGTVDTDQVFTDGTPTIFGSTTSSLTETIDKYSRTNSWSGHPTVSWSTDQFAGKQLMVFGDDDKLHRVDITGNEFNKLTYSPNLWRATGDFAIVEPDGVYQLGRQSWQIGKWYDGAPQAWLTHLPDDSIGSINLAATSVSWGTGSPPACSTSSYAALDIDLWSEATEECSEADKCYSPNLFKSIRAIQHEIISLSDQFVEMKTYDKTGAIPNMTPARLFAKVGINAGNTTIAHFEDGATIVDRFAVDSNYNGFPIYWTIETAMGDTKETGVTVAEDGYVVLGDNSDNHGLKVIYSAGFDRFVPLEFRYRYPKTIFIPDYNGGAVFDPPVVHDYCGEGETCEKSCLGVGHWETREKSTAYVERGMTGYLGDSDREFASDDVARYVGDNAGDPTGVASGTEPPTFFYYDRFFRGTRAPSTQAEIDASRNGRASAGTLKSLTDKDRDWNFWPVMRVETGSATDGDTTTLVDDTKAITAEGNPLSCFWNLSRHTIGGTPVGYKGFILEVDKIIPPATEDDEETTITYKSPIVSVDPATGTITFVAVDGLTVEAGDTYRINEPPELNRWAEHTVKLTYGDGTQAEAIVEFSDEDTLWFTDDLAVPVDTSTTYEIVDEPFGTVWKYSDSGWLKPDGTDPRGAPWLDDQRYDLPHKWKRYGLMRAGDYVTKEVLNQIYLCLNELQWTQTGFSWMSQCPPEDPNYDMTYNEEYGIYPRSGYPLNKDWKYNKNYGSAGTGHVLNDEIEWSEIESSIATGADTSYDAGNWGLMQRVYIPDGLWVQRGDNPRNEGPVTTGSTLFGYGGPAMFGDASKTWTDAGYGTIKELSIAIKEMIFQPLVTGIPTYLPCSKEVYIFTDTPPTTAPGGGYEHYDVEFEDWGQGLDDKKYNLVKSSSAESVTQKYWDWVTAQPTAEGNPPTGSFECVTYGPCEWNGINHPPRLPSGSDIVPITPTLGGGVSYRWRGFQTSKETCILKWVMSYVPA